MKLRNYVQRLPWFLLMSIPGISIGLLLRLHMECYLGEPERLQASPQMTLLQRQASSSYQSAEGVSLPIKIPSPPSSPPAIQMMPSNEAPFIFFHQRKAAGTALRKWIQERAKALGLVSVIPCFDDIPCDIYSLDYYQGLANYQQMSVVAGHFPWGHTQTSLYHNALKDQGHYKSREEDTTSCLTVFREPVSRFLSCYYFRQNGWQRRSKEPFRDIETYSVEEWRMLARDFVDRHGMGCNNEPFRVLTGWGDEYLINTLASATTSVRTLALETAKRNAERCVVGILEDMDTTKEAVTHFFPWMATDESTIDKAMKKGANRAKTGTKQNNADETTKPELPETHLTVILELNAPEIELYEYIKKVLLPRQEMAMRADASAADSKQEARKK